MTPDPREALAETKCRWCGEPIRFNEEGHADRSIVLVDGVMVHMDPCRVLELELVLSRVQEALRQALTCFSYQEGSHDYQYRGASSPRQGIIRKWKAALVPSASSPATVGCERDDGLLNIHPDSETCEVCDRPIDKHEYKISCPGDRESKPK